MDNQTETASQNPIPLQPSTPEIVKASPHRLPLKILIPIVCLIIFIVILLLTILFLSSDSLKNQRGVFFRNINVIFNKGTQIPSPLNLNSPQVLKYGASYLLKGKITDVEPFDGRGQPGVYNGVIIQTDIPGIPDLLIDELVIVFRGTGKERVQGLYQDLRTGQNIHIQVAYSYNDQEWFPMRIFIEN